MRKRITCAAFAVFMALSGLFGTLAFAADAPSSWAAESVNSAISAGLVPENLQSAYTQPITRAEFCALAVALYENAAGKEITGRTEFNDTDDVNVQKIASLGVVKGVDESNGLFDPAGKITREQAATILARLADVMDIELPAWPIVKFDDDSSISSWALDAVHQIKSVDIMSGTGGNNFSPKGDYTREQSILTILRLDNARTFCCEIIPLNRVIVSHSPSEAPYGEFFYERPFCYGSNTVLVNAVNDEFARRDYEFEQAEMKDGPSAFYNRFEGNFPNRPDDGLAYLHGVTTTKTYEKRGVVSFTMYDYFYTCASVHAFSNMDCLTFEQSTGKILSLGDVLNVDSSNVSSVLYNEMLSGNLYNHGEVVSASSVQQNADRLKEASTMETPFYFASDGIHMFYNEYTIAYAIGEFELIIPYSRTDLIRAPYAG